MYKLFDNQEDIVLGNFISYMNKALLHRKLDYLKHKRFLEKRECNLSQEEWEVLSTEDNLLHSSFAFELDKLYEIFEDEHIAKAFKKLTKLQQKVMYWNVVEKMSMSVISKILKVSIKSVEKTKARAFKILEKCLEEYKDVRKK